MNQFEWVKTHRHLQRIGTATNDIGNILVDADVQRRDGNLEAASALAGAARSLVRSNVTCRALYAQLNATRMRAKKKPKLETMGRNR